MSPLRSYFECLASGVVPGLLLLMLLFSATGSPPGAAPEMADGDRKPDGTVFAGISSDTGKAMYTTPGDAPGLYDWDGSQAYCAALRDGGHKDWRAPSKGDLNVLFRNRAAIGGFDESGSDPAGWYWSSSEIYYTAWDQRFSDGRQGNLFKNYVSHLRCVR